MWLIFPNSSKKRIKLQKEGKISMNSGWVYLCVVYRCYVSVFMGIREFLCVHRSLWKAMGMGPKHP